LVGLALVAAVAMVVLVALRITGQVRPFSVPSGGMAPAIERGDHVIMEHFSYLRQAPARGDLLVFDTSEIPKLGNQTYVKRLVGLPGETLRLDDGKLYVNGEPVVLRNKAGDIKYTHLSAYSSKYLRNGPETVTVPPGSYFVLGDNSSHSADSRIWGFVPAESVLGRVVWCYWPPQHAGRVD
jgi:signal peptidase I